MPNPFTPSFGTPPPYLAGRRPLVTEFTDGLVAGPGDPARATLHIGRRGSGKTALLNEIEDAAKAQGWVVVNETGGAGLLDRLITERIPLALRSLKGSGKKTRRRLTGLTGPAGSGGASWETVEDYEVKAGLRALTEEITDYLATHGTGLLFSIDDIGLDQVEEVAQVWAVVQHGFREGRDVAIVANCLGSVFDRLINVPGATFLRRAEQHILGPIATEDVIPGFVIPIKNNGRSITPETAEFAAEATGGYPYMIQLIGRFAWAEAPKQREVTLSHIESGIAAAKRRVGMLVLAPEIKDLSEVDKTFLLAMTLDTGRSKVSDVAKRMGVDGNYANVYRRRLLDTELIVEAGYGYVTFATPGVPEYLSEHAATIGLTLPGVPPTS